MTTFGLHSVGEPGKLRGFKRKRISIGLRLYGSKLRMSQRFNQLHLFYGRIDQFGLCPFLGSSQRVAELIHTSVRQSEFLELLNNCWRRFLAPGKANFGDRNFVADLAPDNCRSGDLYSRYGQQRDSGSGCDQGNQSRHFPTDLVHCRDHARTVKDGHHQIMKSRGVCSFVQHVSFVRGVA